MKRQLILSVCFILGISSHAQNIPNPSFDSVYFGGIDRLFEWITADGFRMATGSNWQDTVNSLAPDSMYQGTGFQFHELLWLNNRSDTSSLSLASTVVVHRPRFKKQDGSSFLGFLIAGNSLHTDALGYPDLSRCGVAFAHRPTKLHGYYHFVDSTAMLNNFGKCIILLRKWNAATQQRDTIAYAETTTELSPTFGFTPFELELTYRSAATPDTIMVAFFGGSEPQNPSALWLDELSFSYSGFGVAEQQKTPIAVYPNPSLDFIKIEAPEGSTYVLCDVQGRRLGTGVCAEKVDISPYAPQVLLLQIYENGNLLHTQRISKIE